jgi:hypothetical protein
LAYAGKILDRTLLATDESSSLPIYSAVVTILRASEDFPAEAALQDDLKADQLRPPISFSAGVVSLEDSLMILSARNDAPAASALKIETGDALWLGETEKCERDGDAWRIRVRLHHVLRDFDTLARLAERFGVAAPSRAPLRA